MSVLHSYVIANYITAGFEPPELGSTNGSTQQQQKIDHLQASSLQLSERSVSSEVIISTYSLGLELNGRQSDDV